MTERTIEHAIATVRTKASGRTRYEGQEPSDDELMLAEIDRLRAERDLYRLALTIIAGDAPWLDNLLSHPDIAREALRLA
jgi:hypothetical protein